MYCIHCGKKLKKGYERFCDKCYKSNTPIFNLKEENFTFPVKSSSNALFIVGVVFAIIAPLIGFIIGIVALFAYNDKGDTGKTIIKLSIIVPIILSIIIMIIGFLIYFAIQFFGVIT